MPITEDQVKFYLSGGSTNSDVFASIGGAMSNTTQIRQDEFNNLWGDIGALDLKIGSIQYRAVYMKNESNNTVFENPRAWFAIKDAYVSIQFTKLGVNKRVTQLPNERTAPPDSEVGPAPPGEVVAKFAIPSGNVSATGSLPDHGPELATDGIKTTAWRYNVFPARLTVDLGVTKSIHYLTLEWGFNTLNPISIGFSIETSNNGTTWNVQSTGTHNLPANNSPVETVSFQPHNARYLRISALSTTNPTGNVGLAMLDLFGASEVGTGGSVPPPVETVGKFSIPSGNTTAIGSLPDHPPEYATDGIKTTAWRYNQFPAWLRVDLGVVKYIHYLTLEWGFNTLNPISIPFSIETSRDGAAWTVQATGTHNLPPNDSPVETVSFQHHNARYLRITAVSTNNPTGNVGLAMLDIFGVSEKLAFDIGGWEGATEDPVTTKSACPHLPPLSYIGLWLRRVIPPNDVAFPTLKQTMKLEVVGGGGTLPPTAPPIEPPPIEPPPIEPPPPGGGGTGTGPYPSTGKQLGSTTRRDTRHYASGKADDETIEKNTKNIPYKHYQCVYYVTVHGVEHDDNVSSKLGGTHMGSGWLDHGVSFNSGKCCLGTEPNHPDTNACIKVGANIGNIKEKRIGIATIWRKPTKHTELWTRLPGANWVKQLTNTGSLGGFTPNNSGDDEAQLRIDGFEDGDDPTIDVAIVQEIAPA